MATAGPSETRILLVEDNPADAELMVGELSALSLAPKVNVVQDGGAALRFVRKEAPFEDSERPDLILLDLNLPRVDGREVLKALKGDTDYLKIPIVVLTSSDDQTDIQQSYAMHANAFMCKPLDLDGFRKIARAIERFWLSHVQYSES